ncbi:MAG: hypothetical protein WBE53_14495, partial [Pseudolabrys sp.]
IQHQLNVLLQQQATLEQHKSALPDDQLATGSISAKAPDSGIIASGPPVAELSSAIAASTPKSASVRHRHRPRVNVGRQRDHSNNLLPLRRSWISAYVILHPSELPPARQQL